MRFDREDPTREEKEKKGNVKVAYIALCPRSPLGLRGDYFSGGFYDFIQRFQVHLAAVSAAAGSFSLYK